MPVVDAFGINKKHCVMADTWGHLYPEPGSKHKGIIVCTHGEYGDLTIIKSDFPTLNDSPQRHQLEHTIFDRIEMEPGSVVMVQCELWFYKSSDEMFLGEDIGKIIKIKATTLIAPE